jgi:hypothetical protein
MPDMNYIPGNQEPRQQPMGPPAYPIQHFAPILPPKKKHTTRNVLLIVLTGLVALCGVGTIVAATTSSGKAGNGAATSPTAAEPGHIKPGQQDPGIAPPVVAQKVAPDPKGFTIGVTVLTKHCFGSAGCNVTFRIDPKYNGTPYTDTTTWTVVYQINGATDAYTGQFTLTGSRASFDSEEMVTTKNSSAVLIAVVTNVVES